MSWTAPRMWPATMLALTAAAVSVSAGDQRHNVLFIVVDNLRPALGAYGEQQAVTPAIDRLAANSTLFSRAFCQESWCSPSRNSFLTGRRPRVTRVWNFRDDFRVNADGTPGAGSDWTTLPQCFKQQGYYTTSSGKVFHPNKPANFDFPKSWSDEPTCAGKGDCTTTPGAAWPATMACALNTTMGTADYLTATAIIDRLTAWSANASMKGAPFFAAAGFQGPRLPWSYPASVLARLPAVEAMHIAKHTASNSGEMEWFRPTEVAWYSDVQTDGGITHARPLSDNFQRRVRLAYYATVTHVDDQVDRLLGALHTLGVDDSTVVVFTADHAQNLGEGNMWSMMSLREQALRVPLMIRDAPQGRRNFVSIYGHPVELVDIYPTIVSLAGLETESGLMAQLSGTDLVPGMLSGAVVKPVDAAFGEITRCKNCSEAYATDPATYERGCDADAADENKFLVPCALTSRRRFDVMGMTVRQLAWRFTIFCSWDGAALAPDFGHCRNRELYSHINDTALYDVDTNGEQRNLAGDPQHADIEAALFKLITRTYGSTPAAGVQVGKTS